jgi:hypothetical protein
MQTYLQFRQDLSRWWAQACAFNTRMREGRERLWKVWWLAGIPVAWLTSLLVVAAEELRSAEYHGWGNFLDILRFLLFVAWVRLAWRCSRNVDSPYWRPIAFAGMGAGLAFMFAF